jgi:3-phenylpropionate/trans-cinnamate dioxygenase ferredoxin reductase component
MTTPQTYVVVGASLAGAKAAETLRTEGFTGRVVLVGEEAERPYERPPLSKDYLRGDAAREKVFVHGESFYADHDIELRTATRATALDPGGHTVTLTQDGHDEQLSYDRLLLTTGAEPRQLDLPGADLPGVYALRSLADADRLARAIREADTVAVIGAGWIGSEVAASARQLGRNVAMIAPSVVPLERVLGVEVGWVYRTLHADHGVDLHLQTGVEALLGTAAVEGLQLSDGTRLAADVVIVGIGAVPRVQLAAAAGLAVDDGIVVDAHLRTSDPDIFAAGDVASALHPVLGSNIRVEHWANALHQGPAAARNMLGIATPYERIPYFFSDQYELGMEYAGYAKAWDRVVFRGDPAQGKFIAFWLAGGLVVAGMNANVWDVTEPIQQLIRDRVAIDPDRLADPDTPLDSLVGTAHAAVRGSVR